MCRCLCRTFSGRRRATPATSRRQSARHVVCGLWCLAGRGRRLSMMHVAFPRRRRQGRQPRRTVAAPTPALGLHLPCTPQDVVAGRGFKLSGADAGVNGFPRSFRRRSRSRAAAWSGCGAGGRARSPSAHRTAATACPRSCLRAPGPATSAPAVLTRRREVRRPSTWTYPLAVYGKPIPLENNVCLATPRPVDCRRQLPVGSHFSSDSATLAETERCRWRAGVA